MNILTITNFNLDIFDPYSIMYCKEWKKTFDSIINLSKNFEQCLIVNDVHNKKDKELCFIPPHCLKDRPIYNLMAKMKGVNRYSKKTFSALSNNHVKQVLLQHTDTLHLCGFNTSMDVLKTALDGIDLFNKIIVFEESCGDIMSKNHEGAINIMRTIGIEIQ